MLSGAHNCERASAEYPDFWTYLLVCLGWKEWGAAWKKVHTRPRPSRWRTQRRVEHNSR